MKLQTTEAETDKLFNFLQDAFVRLTRLEVIDITVVPVEARLDALPVPGPDLTPEVDALRVEVDELKVALGAEPDAPPVPLRGRR